MLSQSIHLFRRALAARTVMRRLPQASRVSPLADRTRLGLVTDGLDVVAVCHDDECAAVIGVMVQAQAGSTLSLPPAAMVA